MKIELKNIVLIPSMNGAYDAFTAKLFINDIHAAYIKNSGRDMVNNIDPVGDIGRQLIKKAEDYCLKLPDAVFEYEGKKHTIKMNLDKFTDELLTQHILKQADKKFALKVSGLMKTGIVIGIPGDTTSYSALDLKAPIEITLTRPGGPERIKASIIREILPALKEGIKILNTNIPEQLLKDAGLNKEQYVNVQTDLQTKAELKPSKKAGRKL